MLSSVTCYQTAAVDVESSYRSAEPINSTKFEALLFPLFFLLITRLQRPHLDIIPIPMEQVSQNYSFGGVIRKYKISSSKSLGGLESQFNVFLPRQAIEGKETKVP